MIVTYANQSYDCTKAIREGEKATLYFADGSAVEFSGVADSAYEKFRFESGAWDVITPLPSDKERLSAIESAVTTLMLAGVVDTEFLQLQYRLGNLTNESVQSAVPLRLTEEQVNSITGGTET